MSLAFGICVCQPFISTKPCWTSLMAHPVSPSKSFVEFCYHVVDADPLAAIDAACEEIALARRIHRAETGQRDFRSGSKGRRYCDQLQHLVFLLVNRSEEHTSELQSLMRISYAVFCLKKNTPPHSYTPSRPHHPRDPNHNHTTT